VPTSPTDWEASTVPTADSTVPDTPEGSVAGEEVREDRVEVVEARVEGSNAEDVDARELRVLSIPEATVESTLARMVASSEASGEVGEVEEALNRPPMKL